MNTKTIKLDPKGLKKGTFVMVEIGKNHFEIGITQMVELQKNKKVPKVLILTAAGFNDITPIFNKIRTPFLPNAHEDVFLKQYLLYSVETKVVVALLAQQKQYLQHHLPEKKAELEAFEKLENILAELCLDDNEFNKRAKVKTKN